MPYYHGSTKIGSLYVGSTKLAKLYKGSTLVYSSAAYPSGTVIASGTNGYTFEDTLPAGRYLLRLTGGGGAGYYVMQYSQYHYVTGGGGANFEGVIRNPTQQTVKLYAGGNGTDSYLNFNGTRMITCGRGSNGSAVVYQGTVYRYDPGAGGTLTVSSDLTVVSTETSGNGETGIHTTDVNAGWGGISGSTQNWGRGEWCKEPYVRYGGVYLAYVGS